MIDKIALLWCTNEGNEWLTELVTLPAHWGSVEEVVTQLRPIVKEYIERTSPRATDLMIKWDRDGYSDSELFSCFDIFVGCGGLSKMDNKLSHALTQLFEEVEDEVRTNEL